MTAQNVPSPLVALKGPSAVARFFGNPVVGMVGTLASVVGVLLGVYFYFQGTKFRELVYYVNPAQAIVVKTGEASRLRVLMGDRELKSDVTTAQIAIWNRGSESLKPADVLKPITIQTVPSVPILEVTLRKKSRDVVDISIDQKHIDEGIVGLSWNILEQGDGGVAQIVYAGNPENTRIIVSGAIEGKREIRQLHYSGTIVPPAEQVRQQSSSINSLVLLAVGLLGICSSLLIIWMIRKYEGNGRWTRRALVAITIFMILLSIFSLCASIYYYLTLPDPPFGF